MLKLFKNFKIGRRLRITFLTIIAAFIIFVVISVTSTTKISNNVSKFYDESYTISVAALKSKEALVSIQKSVYQIASSENTSLSSSLIDNLNLYSSEFDKSFAIVKEKFSGDIKLIDDFSAKVKESSSIYDKIIKLVQSKDTGAIKVLEDEYIPIINSAQQILNSIIDQETEKALGFKNSVLHSKNINIIILSILLLLVLLSITGVYYIIFNSLTKPIEELDKAAKQISDGNLDTDITYESKDELGNLAKSMRSTIKVLNSYISDISTVLQSIANKDLTVKIHTKYIGNFIPIKDSMQDIINSLNHTMNNINCTAEQVASSSTEIAKASQEIADGAMYQSCAVEQLLATVNDVVENVNQNANEAKNVSNMSLESIKYIENGNEYMQNLLAVMNKINYQTVEISKITKLVDNISSQTNLLSLNASIEAARAGESGKGFAVVANEIGKLANESAQATRNINKLIEETLNIVDEGSIISTKTAEALTKVVDTSNKSNTLIEGICNDCLEQAHSLSDILRGIEQISEVVQSNSSVAAETSASSESLSSHANQVADLLSEFKLNL